MAYGMSIKESTRRINGFSTTAKKIWAEQLADGIFLAADPTWTRVGGDGLFDVDSEFTSNKDTAPGSSDTATISNQHVEAKAEALVDAGKCAHTTGENCKPCLFELRKGWDGRLTARCCSGYRTTPR